MASEIRANTLKNRVGLGTISFTDTGPVVSGIVTATSFSGDGSNLTGITGTTINNNADNRIITGSGTANTLNGESTLTYSGDTLLSTNSNFVIKSIDTNASNAENFIQFNAGYITYDSDASNSTGNSGHYFQVDGSEKLRINNSGQLIFDADTDTYLARPAADTFAFTTGGSERLRIASKGGHKITCAETYYAANLTECNTDQLALNINQTRQGVTKGIAFGAIGSSNTHTGIQCYDTSNNSANPLSLNPFGGNIGINTNNPQRILHAFEPSTNNLLFLESGNTNCDIIQADPGGSTRIRSTQGNFYLYTNGDASSSSAANSDLAFRIDADKDVHIYDDLFIGDLKIYHSGSHAYVNNDTGDLYIQTDNNFKLEAKDGGNDMIHAIPTGQVELHYNGTKTFQTSSTGCSIFGTLEASDTGYGSGSSNIEIQPYGQRGYINFTGTNTFYFRSGSSYTTRWTIDSNGHFSPGADNTYDFGSTALRWRNIYTADLQLSNKGKSNDVDGTWGNYTIQEGESDLFLINNRNGKKYKFNLTEVS